MVGNVHAGFAIQFDGSFGVMLERANILKTCRDAMAPAYDEVASSILFLASAEARVMHGAVLVIDGGYTIF